MWPKETDWTSLKFGVEIEFIGGEPERLELLPGWVMSLDERQIDETGEESGSELKTPPLLWGEREQIAVMLERLQAQGAAVNWSCGLHVHVGLEPWGERILLPLLDAALAYQHALRALLRTAEHRLLFCPPVTAEMRDRCAAEASEDSVRRRGRPQSHRCGVNAAAWFDIGTAEIRYANGSMDYQEILRTVQLYLRFIAAVGAGHNLSGKPHELAALLGVPARGYPAPIAPPRWFRERTWLDNALIPLLAPMAGELVPGGEIHHILPYADGLSVAIEGDDGRLRRYALELPTAGWNIVRRIP